MDFKELNDFITLENDRLRKKYGNYSDEEKRILVRTVKLSEEFGELCEQVLTHRNLQRQEKLDNKSKDDLSDEFADVIITTMLLAKSMNVDLETALKNKIEKINKRYQ